MPVNLILYIVYNIKPYARYYFIIIIVFCEEANVGSGLNYLLSSVDKVNATITN